MQITLKKFFSTELATLEISDLAGDSSGRDGPTVQVRGVYAKLDNTNVGLAVYEGQLFLIISECLLEVNEGLSVNCIADGKHSKLFVKNEHRHYTVEYESENDAVSTPYYSEDEEDANFGVWLSNVLASPERKSIFVRSWAS